MSVRPWTLTSGFGSVSVIGRMRVPSPAANTMAVFGTGGLIGPQRSGRQGRKSTGGGPSARGKWFRYQTASG